MEIHRNKKTPGEKPEFSKKEIKEMKGLCDGYSLYLENVKADILNTIQAIPGMKVLHKETAEEILLEYVKIHSTEFSTLSKKVYALYGMINRKQGGGNIINDQDIARAKDYPIDSLVEFDRSGKRKCIFHEEKTPSLKYYKNTNTVHCFGSCNKTWDSISVYQKVNGCDFKEAVKALS